MIDLGQSSRIALRFIQATDRNVWFRKSRKFTKIAIWRAFTAIVAR